MVFLINKFIYDLYLHIRFAMIVKIDCMSCMDENPLMLDGYFSQYLLGLGHWLVMCLFALTTKSAGNGIIVVCCLVMPH